MKPVHKLILMILLAIVYCFPRSIQKLLDIDFFFSQKASSKRVAKVPQPQLSSSETEEEIIITTPRIEEASLQNAVQYQHCVCECPNRPENNGRVVVRSRSISPGRDRQRARSGYYKPPFKAGKAPQDLISRRDFGLSPSRLASSSKSYGDGNIPHVFYV